MLEIAWQGRCRRRRRLPRAASAPCVNAQDLSQARCWIVSKHAWQWHAFLSCECRAEGPDAGGGTWQSAAQADAKCRATRAPSLFRPCSVTPRSRSLSPSQPLLVSHCLPSPCRRPVPRRAMSYNKAPSITAETINPRVSSSEIICSSSDLN